MAAHQRGDAAGIVGATVFATTMVLLYLASTLFHALPPNRPLLACCHSRLRCYCLLPERSRL